MTDTVTIPKVEYERLCAMEEDLADLQAALAVQVRIDAGVEELVPWEVAGRLIDGEPAVRVWREGFEEWDTVVSDEVMAAALIDRLLHHCHIVNIRGNSYRMRTHQHLLRHRSDDEVRSGA